MTTKPRRKAGTGSVVVKGDARYLVFRVDGKQKWERTDAKNDRDAEKLLRKRLNEVDEQRYVSPSKTTLAQYLEKEWLPSLRLAEQTMASYSKNVRLHLVPRLGDVPLASLTPPKITAAYNEMLTSGRVDGKGGLSARTVRYCHTILGKALREAVEAGLLVTNPASRAKPPSAEEARSPEKVTWTREQLAAFLSGQQEHRLHPLLVFLATTGCRRGEALGLRWRDVDLEKGRAVLRQTVGAISGRVVVKATPKSSKARPVDLDPTTVAVLRTHKARQAEERLSLGGGYQDQGLVFSSVTGEPTHPERFWRTFVALVASHNRTVEKSGGVELTPLSPHGLRHTWATLALESGVHPKVVQERLGHANVSITLDIYSHVSPTIQREAADLVAASIFGGGA